MRSFLNASPLKKTLDNWYFLYFCLLLVAYLSRAALLGNPFIFFDEEFYLFVGGRMLHGDLPYVDIWDRKPIGIFLIYEFFHLFGPYRIWAYQIGALLSAWLTSIFCLKIARSIAPIGGAFCAGCLYLIWSVGFGGMGGQSPIFYNTLITAAILIILQGLQKRTVKNLTISGWVSMVLFGLSIQIKPTVAFEGIYVALFLLYILYKHNIKILTLFITAFGWSITALLPSFCVIVTYASLGHLSEWWFANVISIFLKQDPPHNTLISLWHWAHWGIILGVLFVSTIGGRFLLLKARPNNILHIFIMGWAFTAFLGFFIFGSFATHYALPLFAPFFINAAPLWSAKVGRLWLTFLTGFGAVCAYYSTEKVLSNGSQKDLTTITQLLSSAPGCVLMDHGPDIILDALPHYCPVTTLPFSWHLDSAPERKALPLDPATEIKRIFQTPPRYIILDSDVKDYSGGNIDVINIVHEHIMASYHEIYRHKRRKDDNILIYMHN
ncbi:ArnT family glycosyltransferase [Bombella pollinis]|uniref:Glycosyltransferase RgtA/B/C/D-like domain-containing protein n=1 Tax=Bombella pollinis TaxID=2967337 RepID=A0ABT3WJH2_9PROT|nr:hypothetical protein [Bombella pollinis]MCX5619073.1 hypothetical protein [Bombella pollinis]